MSKKIFLFTFMLLLLQGMIGSLNAQTPGDSKPVLRRDAKLPFLLLLMQRMGPESRKIIDFSVDNFVVFRNHIDPEDTSQPSARFIGSRVEVMSDRWVYYLDTAGQQVFKPRSTSLHMKSTFTKEISPNLAEWERSRVPETANERAKQIALEVFGAGYVYDPATRVIPVRELITSAAAGSDIIKSYEGRTSVLFRSSTLENDRTVTYRNSFYTTDGIPIVEIEPVSAPSRAYETAITFAPEGHIMRVESSYLSPKTEEMVDFFRQAVSDGLVSFQPIFYGTDLKFGSFFSPNEPRLELTAYSYEGEQFLNLLMLGNPYTPFVPLDYCYDSPYAPDVNQEIRPSREYRYHVFNIWHQYGRKNGIRGNWNHYSKSWQIPDVDIQVHADLFSYNTLEPHSGIILHKACDDVKYPFLYSVGNKLEKKFYDDLESCQVAMINTHGGPIESHRIGRKTFQFLRNRDQWVTLHEEGDDSLGSGKLRHLFLETCSGINWRNNFRGDPKTLFTDWMNAHVAGGIRTIGGFDGCRVAGNATGWRFFGHYHNGESISQSWIAMGLEEYACNMPIVVAYGANEEETTQTLFDGRFDMAPANKGWVIAVEPITEEHLEPRPCCLLNTAGPPCVMLSHPECEDIGGEPLDCGMTCDEHGDKCQ